MTRVDRALVSLAAIALAVFTAQCGGAPDAHRPRLVVFIAPCTVPCGFLSPYDSSIDFTPNLARLAKGGVVFERHMTETPQSGTAFASIFTGTQAPIHGVFAHPTRLADSLHLIGEVFAEEHFDTWFWGGHELANGDYNYGQGVPREHLFNLPLQGSDPNFQELLKGLRADPSKHAFVLTNFSVTHSPYSPRNVDAFCAEFPRYAAARATKSKTFQQWVALYTQNFVDLSNDFPATVARLKLSPDEVRELAGVVDLLFKSNVHFLDLVVGSVLDAIEKAGVLDDSLIVFNADHGEMPYRDDILFPWTHGWELAPEETEVPWIVKLPKSEVAAPKYEGVTRSIDVFPTIAGLAGIPLTAANSNPSMGVDLSAAVLGRALEPELQAFSHTPIQHQQFAARVQNAAQWLKYHTAVGNPKLWVSLRSGDQFFKYRNLDGTNWGMQLFDLARDPTASHDVFDANNPKHQEAKARLLDYQATLARAWNAKTDKPAPDEAAQKILEKLGYVK